VDRLTKVSNTALLKEYRRRFWQKKGHPVTGSKEAAAHLALELGKDTKRESLAVIFLDGANGHIATSVLFEGTLTQAAVFPREVVRRALSLGAGSIVLGHNHPSGCLTASREDKDVTQQIKKACGLFEIAVLDHLILGGQEAGYYSFADNGLL